MKDLVGRCLQVKIPLITLNGSEVDLILYFLFISSNFVCSDDEINKVLENSGLSYKMDTWTLPHQDNFMGDE